MEAVFTRPIPREKQLVDLIGKEKNEGITCNLNKMQNGRQVNGILKTMRKRVAKMEVMWKG